MEHYAGIDVSLEYSSVCVVDASGKIVREGKAVSEPDALINWLKSLGYELSRIGLEAGPLSQWLFAALRKAGLAVELLETRHVRKAFEAMPVKSDRNDARGIAQLMRLGWFRPVHCKSMGAQEVRAVLTARKLVQTKLLDVENSLRGILRGFGLKVGETDHSGRISKIGDASVREALYQAAHVMLTKPVKGCSQLKSWAMRIARRAGMSKAKVALARKLAVILHRMLANATPFNAAAAAA